MNTFKNRPLAVLTTFVVSALIHDWLLAMSLGFYNPITIILFLGAGVTSYFLAPQLKQYGGNLNTAFLTGMFIGMALNLITYGAEYYARINCPSVTDSWLLDKVTPRLITCYL